MLAAASTIDGCSLMSLFDFLAMSILCNEKKSMHENALSLEIGESLQYNTTMHLQDLQGIARRILGNELVAVRARGEGRRVEVEEVDLLERQTLGLGDEEEREGEAQEAAAAPDEEHLGAEVGVAGTVVDEVGR